jgi:hypothetical protein
MKELRDAEASYRRGYHQGAADALDAVERLGRLPSTVIRLREWVGVTLHRWRYHDRPDDRTVQPPQPSADGAPRRPQGADWRG